MRLVQRKVNDSATSRNKCNSSRSCDSKSLGSQISNSSSVIARRQLEIELRRQEEIAKLEQEQCEREKKIIELRAKLAEAKLIEFAEYNGRSKASEISDEGSVVGSERWSHSKVADWLQRRSQADNKSVSRESFENQKLDTSARLREMSEQKITARTKCRTLSPKIDSTYIARQSMGKELPIFKGSITDWILFEKIFHQTTDACSFSPAENMLRLRKCLQEDALEAVRALLMTTNVEKVMDVLKRRFGRADYIIEDQLNKLISLPSVKEDLPIMMIKFAETDEFSGYNRFSRSTQLLIEPQFSQAIDQ